MPAFRLIDDYQAKYMKFAGREPSTLQELAVARANFEHGRRTAEIRAMAKKLELLDAFLPALLERGISFAHRDISSTDGGKSLRIHPGFPTMQDDKLHEALLALGFREVERNDYGRASFRTVTLKHGRALLVTIDITKVDAPAPQAEGVTA
jgi:hypothetical protein